MFYERKPGHISPWNLTNLGLPSDGTPLKNSWSSCGVVAGNRPINGGVNARNDDITRRFARKYTLQKWDRREKHWFIGRGLNCARSRFTSRVTVRWNRAGSRPWSSSSLGRDPTVEFSSRNFSFCLLHFYFLFVFFFFFWLIIIGEVVSRMESSLTTRVS